MFAATTSPWYLPTWVSSRMPVTSPTAHRRSPARRCASTWMPCSSNLAPAVSRPSPPVRGRRPVATSSWSPCSSGRRRAPGRSPHRRGARRSPGRPTPIRRRQLAEPRRAPRRAAPAPWRARVRRPRRGSLRRPGAAPPVPQLATVTGGEWDTRTGSIELSIPKLRQGRASISSPNPRSPSWPKVCTSRSTRQLETPAR
jgi:hypothetical protein